MRVLTDWTGYFQEHYLENHIAQGGSKVKVLTGEPDAISALMQRLEAKGKESHFQTIHLSARKMGRRLNDLPNLYRLLVARIDLSALFKGLTHQIIQRLGYAPDTQGGNLLNQLIAEGLQRTEAVREIRQATGSFVRELDLTVSFSTLVYTLVRESLVANQAEELSTALKWLKGEKLEPAEKQATGLYEALNRRNARCWINSLVHLIKASGQQGLMVMIDELEVMTERSESSQRFLYSPSAVQDTCELFRQLIDDVELMRHFILILGGSPVLLEDEKRGFKSYEALWMRLQTGLVPGKEINLLSDLIALPPHFSQGVLAQ